MKQVSYEQARRRCNPEALGFKLTSEIPPADVIIGQERAINALKFGLEIQKIGFNIYAAGSPGTGKTTAVNNFLQKVAKKKPTPPDWCYVYNFQDPYQPKAIDLPPGKGKEFKSDMQELVKEAKKSIQQAFESEEYRKKRESILDSLKRRQEEILSNVAKTAQQNQFLLQTTPVGFALVPLFSGKPMTDQQFMSLSPQTREEIQKKREKLGELLENALREIHQLEKEATKELKDLDDRITLHALRHPMEDIREQYRNNDKILAYLQEVEDDMVKNLDKFRAQPAPQQPPAPGLTPEKTFWRRYEVNLVVDNSGLDGAPVVMELNPTYNNLFGRLEKEASLGTLHTDFTLIKPGAMHRANGGYLVLEVLEVLNNLFSWDGLKRALRNQQIIIEEMGERLGFVATKGLRPEPIPLDVKVILIGDPRIYYLLYNFDDDFNELFKVKADFSEEMPFSMEHVQEYAAFISSMVQKENLLPFTAEAVAKIVEQGGRAVQDQKKLSAKFSLIADLTREATFWAQSEGSEVVDGRHVDKAIEEKVYRSNLIEERLREMTIRGFIKIDTEGSVVGQVNGLSVIDLGDYSFGKPTRITASLGVGRAGVVDIEREVELAGPIYSKGVMILEGFLHQRYAQDKPLTLSSRLVFEQSYSEVEGDSASSAELYALLSRLSDLPIRQDIAVTGSINQKGEIQAIGGVNEKIEGFFDVCRIRGLTGNQGVIIPSSNVENLMLREDVVEAIKDGKFHVYAVDTVDEGIEILTGVPAGEPDESGEYPPDTVNGKVNAKLAQLAERLQEFGKEKESDEGKE